MSHNFKDLGKKTSFVSRKEIPWHGLGKIVDAMTSQEAIELGGLDYEVGLAPIYAGVQATDVESSFEHHTVIRDNGTEKEETKLLVSKKIKTNFATYRTDTNDVFGVVGSRYEVIQNTEAFNFFDEVIGHGHAQYETVGALGNGEKVFITAKLPSKLIVKKEDIDKYLLFTMAHDGSGAILVMFTPIRVVCNNTLTMAIQGASNKVSIRHTKNARNRLEEAKKVLGLVENRSEDFSLIFNKFADEYLEDKKITEIIKTSFGLVEQEDGKLSTRAQNILDGVLEYHEVGFGQQGIQGSKWGVLNAVTGYQQNVQKFRNEESKFESVYSKNAANIRQKAFNELLKIY